MPTIRPLRDINEHEVINFFALDAASGSKGTFVKITGNGWTNDDQLSVSPVGNQYHNTVSNRYSVPSRVSVANSGDIPLGILLYDVTEVDENGELLIYKPQKAAEMQAVVSGQVVPILTRGTVLYSGVNGTPVAGQTAWLDNNGGITCTGFNAVGKFLGTKDSHNWVLVKITL